MASNDTATTTTPATLDIRVPGSVWNDYLDPSATTMQAELELPKPVWKKSGSHQSAIYTGVPPAVARELADYLFDRADSLLGNIDTWDRESAARERRPHYAAKKVAEAIYTQLEGRTTRR